MNNYEKQIIEKSRDYIVAKSNTIVQKSRYNFSLQEQRMIAYICSKIKPISMEDHAKGVEFQLDYDFSVQDYIRICGLQDNGKLYDEIKDTLKGLRDKSMWLTLPDGKIKTVGWLEEVTLAPRDGTVEIRINKNLAPYLFDLRAKFLSYGLKNILNMRSQYSIRIYELVKSYHDMKYGQINPKGRPEDEKTPVTITWIMDLDDFKHRLMLDTIKSYASYGNLKKFVLDVAQHEINTLTDITVNFTPIRKGRKTVKLQIDIKSKDTLARYITAKKNDDLLS